MTKPRTPKATSTQFALDTAQALNRGLPPAPESLDPESAEFWSIILRSKAPDDWTGSDLVQAVQLCRDLALRERLAANAQGCAPYYIDDKGKTFAHPVFGLLDQTCKRIRDTCRATGINPAATQGKPDHRRLKNAEARRIAAAIGSDPDDDLIARPKLVGYDDDDDDDLFA